MRLGWLGLAALAGATAAAAPPAVASSFNCDTIEFQGQLDPATAKALEPAHSLAAAAEVLTRHKVPFKRSRGVLTATLPPAVYQGISKLPQGEPFVLPSPQGGYICVLIPAADSV